MRTPDTYISYFTPREMSAETLEFIFVKREKLAARLVERVRDSILSSAKYQSLLIGPRGIGKSHMVAMTYYRVKALSELEGKIAVAWLAEEEWGVASLTDLYMVILEALEQEYGTLRTQIDAIYDEPDHQRATIAADLIREFTGDRTLFLLVENLGDLFKALSRDELWACRSFLSKTPFATVLATTPSLTSALSRQSEAFFGFFQPFYLEELSVDEATELLGKMAERRDDTALTNFLATPTAHDRVQVVHALAGGHPRLYLLFAHLLTQSNLDELVTPFLEFLDELTPYFQDRMKGLSPQQRKIVTFLCDRRGAVAVKEIAARTNGITSQTISGQLDKLEEMGYVRKNRVGRESHYELREPLLRMIVEKKRGRNEPIRLIVDFLRRWYSRDERRNRLNQSGGKDKTYWQASLDLNLAMQDTPDPKRATELSPEFNDACNNGDYTRGSKIAAEIIERKGRFCENDDWFWYGWCLAWMGEYGNALHAYEKAIAIDSSQAADWSNRGYVLGKLGRYDDALASCKKSTELEPMHYSAWSVYGDILIELGRYDEALAMLEKALQIRPQDATAWNSRGHAFFLKHEYEEALASVDNSINADPKSAAMWSNRGRALLALKRYDEAISALDTATNMEPNDSLPFFERAKIYLRRDQWDEFRKSVTTGFTFALTGSIWEEDAYDYCQTLLQQNLSDNLEKIKFLVLLYAKYEVMATLGQGLTDCIPALASSGITPAQAELWLDDWNSAGVNQKDLIVPLRLLAAAVAWKPKHDPRALLALPIEERQVLETLLEAEKNAQD